MFSPKWDIQSSRNVRPTRVGNPSDPGFGGNSVGKQSVTCLESTNVRRLRFFIPTGGPPVRAKLGSNSIYKVTSSSRKSESTCPRSPFDRQLPEIRQGPIRDCGRMTGNPSIEISGWNLNCTVGDHPAIVQAQTIMNHRRHALTA